MENSPAGVLGVAWDSQWDHGDPSHGHATRQPREGHNSSLQPGLEVAGRDGTQDAVDLYLGAPQPSPGLQEPLEEPLLGGAALFPAHHRQKQDQRRHAVGSAEGLGGPRLSCL